MLIHRAVLCLWAIELTIFPVLALLDLGFAFDFKSNYYARFAYIGLLALAILYHAVVKRRLVLPVLSVLFLLVLGIGSAKGLWAGQLNTAFLSHVFYVVMPIVMISFGWHFFSALRCSSSLRRMLAQVMLLSLGVGIAVVAAFVVTRVTGLADYDAIGLWNFVYSGPSFLHRPGGVAILCISTLGALLAAKRGVLIVFFLYIVLLFFLFNLQRRIQYLMAGIAALLGLAYFGNHLEFDMASRLAKTRELLAEGEIETASAGRWSEAASAIEYLNTRPDHWLVGAGFGARFLPWPDREEYANYYSHYTHFGMVSYVWIGGLLFSGAIYFLLGRTAVRLTLKAKRGWVKRDQVFWVFWIWGILGISLFGAVLMNNAWLWLIVGCCLHLDQATTRQMRAARRKGLISPEMSSA